MKAEKMMIRMVYLFITFVSFLQTTNTTANDQVDYLRQIKPIFAEKCYSCHGALKQEGELRLETRSLMLKGGDSGPAIVVGSANGSYLFERVTDHDNLMPPEGEGGAFSKAQVKLLKDWINQGAKAPREAVPEGPQNHWAYQKPVRSEIPKVKNKAWASHPVDAFLAREYERQGLKHLKPASPGLLLRRIYLDLTGLPPPRDELMVFLENPSKSHYNKIVDQLLNSHRYGERWGRHWMDIWRYSDPYETSAGIARWSRVHIWRWRDWIVESLNQDKGYDRMVLEMLAGDELAPQDADTVRATGFLARNWYLLRREPSIEKAIEHTAKAFLGITMNCAKCHDHKYDPIRHEDYYHFRAFFETYDVRTDRLPGEPDLKKLGLDRVADTSPDRPTYLFIRGNDEKPDKSKMFLPQVPSLLGGKLNIQPISLPLEVYYPGLSSWVIQEELQRIEETIKKSQKELTQKKKELENCRNIVKKKSLQAHLLALQNLATADLLVELKCKRLKMAQSEKRSFQSRVNAEKMKYGLIPKQSIVQVFRIASEAERQYNYYSADLNKFEAFVKLFKIQQKIDSEKKTDPKFGEALNKARLQYQSAQKKEAESFQKWTKYSDQEYGVLGIIYPQISTGRRLALGRWMTSTDNPLVARVAINHIWLRHFGSPLVDNMFDFGLRTKKPIHSDLLDWLSVELMEHGWSMKHIHKLIVTSNAYRMQSTTRDATDMNFKIDPDNILLWRMNSRRLEAEAVRDSILYVCGSLSDSLGGPFLKPGLGMTSKRRSIYFFHSNDEKMQFMSVFDAADVNECYRRSESVVPQQALAMSNSQISIEQARLMAKRIFQKRPSQSDAEFITLAFEYLLCRAPNNKELRECRDFLGQQQKLFTKMDQLHPFVQGKTAKVSAASNFYQRARENLVHVLLNHSDFVTIR